MNKRHIEIGTKKFFVAESPYGEKPLIYIPGWLPTIDFLPYTRLYSPDILKGFSPYKLILINLSNLYKAGMSSRPYTLEDYSTDLNDLLDFYHYPSVDLIGHSAGGRIAIHYTATHSSRVSNLVLLSSAGLNTKKPGEKKLSRVNGYFAKPFAVGKSHEILRQTFASLYSRDCTPFMHDITKEVLILWGEKDSTMSVSQGYKMEKVFPNAHLETFPSLGHMAILDNRVRKRIHSFLTA